MANDGSKNKLIIKVLGEEYVIRSPSSTEHMLKVGEYVNNLMKDLSGKYPRMSVQKIAVLACLNLASDLLLLRNQKKKKGEQKK